MKNNIITKGKGLSEKRKFRNNIIYNGMRVKGEKERKDVPKVRHATRFFSLKGQSAILTKPIILVLVISVMIILIYSVYSSGGVERLKEREIDLRTTGTNTILVLANSEQCLAYRVPIILGGYANIVDIEKLQFFAFKYKNIEPLCARNFDFGWRTKVNEIDKSGKIVNTWSFGAKSFSKSKALHQGIITNMPIAIRYSKYDIRPGKIEIEVVDGELEQLSGFVDKVCSQKSSKSTGINFVASYPVYFENSDLCMGFGNDKACKQLLCPTQMEDLKPGSYYLSGSYSNGKVNIIR